MNKNKNKNTRYIKQPYTTTIYNNHIQQPPPQPLKLLPNKPYVDDSDDSFVRNCIHHIRSYGSFSESNINRFRSCSDAHKMEIIIELNIALEALIDSIMND